MIIFNLRFLVKTACTEGARDDIHIVHLVVPLSNASTMVAVEADSVHLVNKCESPVAVGDLAQLLKGTDSPRHGVYGFKSNNLGDAFVHLGQKLLQVLGVVVPENVLWHLAVADALNH